MISAVILDYGGVILDMRWDVTAALEAEHELPAGSIATTLYGIDAWRRVEIGIGEVDAWERDAHAALERVGGRALPSLHRLWRDEQRFLDDNLDLVRRLRPGYKTTVLSNASITLRTRLERVTHLFDDIVCSAEVAMAKPDPRIYALAAQRLALEPGACVFVDDSIPNVEAARAAGMHGVHFHVANGTRLEDLLAELGVTAR